MFDSSKILWRPPWCPIPPDAAARLEAELRNDLLAVVHLTWKKEIMEDWPDAESFMSAAEFVERRMIPDAEGR